MLGLTEALPADSGVSQKDSMVFSMVDHLYTFGDEIVESFKPRLVARPTEMNLTRVTLGEGHFLGTDIRGHHQVSLHIKLSCGPGES